MPPGPPSGPALHMSVVLAPHSTYSTGQAPQPAPSPTPRPWAPHPGPGPHTPAPGPTLRPRRPSPAVSGLRARRQTQPRRHGDGPASGRALGPAPQPPREAGGSAARRGPPAAGCAPGRVAVSGRGAGGTRGRRGRAGAAAGAGPGSRVRDSSCPSPLRELSGARPGHAALSPPEPQPPPFSVAGTCRPRAPAAAGSSGPGAPPQLQGAGSSSLTCTIAE